MSKIIPIFRADGETDACNFIDQFHYCQTFRQAHSIDHAVLDMVESIRTNMDKKLFPVECSLILKKPLILWTIKYYLINLIITAFDFDCGPSLI